MEPNEIAWSWPARPLDLPRLRRAGSSLHDPTSGLWFAISTALFVVLGLFLKSRLLNWVAGPLFPVVLLYMVPRAACRLWKFAFGRPSVAGGSTP